MLWSGDVVIGLVQRGYDKFKKEAYFQKRSHFNSALLLLWVHEFSRLLCVSYSKGFANQLAFG